MNKQSLSNFKVEFGDNQWIGKLNEMIICEFAYEYDPQGNAWLCGAKTEERFQKKGYGTTMIKAFILEYGKLYFSSASQLEHEQNRGEEDTRYLSSQGVSLVKKCIMQRIVKEEWLRNPFLSMD